MDLKSNMPRVLIDSATIAERVAEMGRAIAADYAERDVLLVPVLKGSFVFAADLARAIDLPLAIDFLGVRSYGAGTETSGVVQITHDLSHPISGKDVILVEDIIDTGLTMAYLFEVLATRHPRSIAVASLLHKPSRTRTPIEIKYLGFTVDDVFVVGYGLDHAERHRNLPYLAVLEEEA